MLSGFVRGHNGETKHGKHNLCVLLVCFDAHMHSHMFPEFMSRELLTAGGSQGVTRDVFLSRCFAAMLLVMPAHFCANSLRYFRRMVVRGWGAR